MKQYENIKSSFFQSHRSDTRLSNYGRIYKNKYSIAFFRPKIRTLGREQIKKKREHYRVNAQKKT